MDVRKVATQLSLKPKPPLTLKALIDKYAASTPYMHIVYTYQWII
jgi:hypothetical protein